MRAGFLEACMRIFLGAAAAIATRLSRFASGLPPPPNTMLCGPSLASGRSWCEPTGQLAMGYYRHFDHSPVGERTNRIAVSRAQCSMRRQEPHLKGDWQIGASPVN